MSAPPLPLGPPPALNPAYTPQAAAAILAPLGPFLTANDCCKASDALLKAWAPNDQWPCTKTYLFGACGGTTARPCRRCANPRPRDHPPMGVRPAVKAACSDPAVQALILAGG